MGILTKRENLEVRMVEEERVKWENERGKRKNWIYR